MLLKNGKEFNLDAPENKEELNSFLKAIPPFNKGKALVVKYHKDLYTWSDLNGRWESPEARHTSFREVINRPNVGNETWIYCENFEIHQATGAILSRSPWDFQLSGTKTITWENKDLAFFLWLSKNCGNGEEKRENCVYVFEDKEFDARVNLEYEREEARVKSVILNDEVQGGLSDDRIDEMIRAYQLPKGMGRYQSRQMLFSQVSKERNGFNRFITLMENPYEKERMLTINKAKEIGVLALKGMKIETGTGNNQGWNIIDRNGKSLMVFAKHRKTGKTSVNADKYLMEALDHNEGLWKQIESTVKTRDILEVEE